MTDESTSDITEYLHPVLKASDQSVLVRWVCYSLQTCTR